MEYVAIIISLIALVGAGFAFIRANSSHHILSKRIEALKDHNKLLVERLGRMEGNNAKGNRQQPERENRQQPEREEAGRRNQQREQQREQQAEGRVNQPRAEQQEQRQKQQRQEQQQRTDQQRNEQQQEQRQKQRERQQQQRQSQQPVAQEPIQPEQEIQQPRRRKENRRRNEPSDRQNLEETDREARPIPARPVKLEFAEGDLLDELEQAAGNPAAVAALVDTPYTGKKFAIIPEDGVIRLHQLQQQADSDSYIEVDHPAEGSNVTHYRFNLSGNHAFVIAQGIDRLENAFDFEKPSNRMVTKVVQQQDGVLTKVNNGWKIMEKARIDFR